MRTHCLIFSTQYNILEITENALDQHYWSIGIWYSCSVNAFEKERECCTWPFCTHKCIKLYKHRIFPYSIGVPTRQCSHRDLFKNWIFFRLFANIYVACDSAGPNPKFARYVQRCFVDVYRTSKWWKNTNHEEKKGRDVRAKKINVFTDQNETKLTPWTRI